MTSFAERENASQGVSWGKVIAGAAVATGAFLLGVSVLGGEVPILSDVADGVKDMLVSVFESIKNAITATPTPTEAPDTGLMKDIGEFLTKNAKALSGSALLGGGAAYLALHGGETPNMQYASVPVSDARLVNAEMGFAAKEQMRAANALMQARMQAFGQNPNTQR